MIITRAHALRLKRKGHAVLEYGCRPYEDHRMFLIVTRVGGSKCGALDHCPAIEADKLAYRCAG